MPRLARFIEANGFYHIISRSLNETYILRDDNDFSHFFQLLHTAKQKYPIFIFHYVVMNTHFHLVAQAPNHEILSKNIAYLKWHYSLWMHKKYSWKGPLWRERYKSLPIENENYLYSCGMYIEYNPVRAGICENPADYPYSSYRKYNSELKDTLIDEYQTQSSIAHQSYQHQSDSHPKHQGHQGNCHVLCDCHLRATKQLDFRSPLLKNFFSYSPAIGTPFFIENFKQSQNACPQK